VSLRIYINTIARLLLWDGVWYEVLPGSFTVDSFDWTDSDGLVVDGGDIAGWRRWVYGLRRAPLSATGVDAAIRSKIV
jgi:hypothetical protein